MKIFSFRNSEFEEELRSIGVNVCSYGADISINVNKKIPEEKYKKFHEKFCDEKPDLFIFGIEPYFPYNTMKNIRKDNPKTKFIMWYCDPHWKSPAWPVKRWKEFLDILCINTASVDVLSTYKQYGLSKVFTLFQGSSRKIKPNLKVSNRCFDVFFGGGYYPKKTFPNTSIRLKTILNIKATNKLHIFGRYFPFKTNSWIPWSDRASLYKEIQKCKISLGINQENSERYYTRRIYDCIGSGSCHLTYYIPNMEKDWGNNGEYVYWFKTQEECLSRIRKLKEDPDLLEKTYKKAYNFAQENHTWKSRALEILKYVEG